MQIEYYAVFGKIDGNDANRFLYFMSEATNQFINYIKFNFVSCLNLNMKQKERTTELIT